MRNRQAGIIFININGRGVQPKGAFKYNIGAPKNEALLSSSGRPVGYKSTTQVPSIDGLIFDDRELSLKDLTALDNGTAVLSLANGKQIVLQNCWYAGAGDGDTDEGTFTFRLEGLNAEELR